MRKLLALVVLSLLLLLGCDLAEETKGEAEDASGTAVGIAEKMKGGTVGAYDEDEEEGDDAESTE